MRRPGTARPGRQQLARTIQMRLPGQTPSLILSQTHRRSPGLKMRWCRLQVKRWPEPPAQQRLEGPPVAGVVGDHNKRVGGAQGSGRRQLMMGRIAPAQLSGLSGIVDADRLIVLMGHQINAGQTVESRLREIDGREPFTQDLVMCAHLKSPVTSARRDAG